MKRYFQNHWTALLGRNPYQRELDRVTVDCTTLVAQKNRELTGYQTLVENLRYRLTEKDMLMERLKKDYQERIGWYNARMDELQNKEKTE